MTDTEFKIQLHSKLCDLADLFLYHYNPCLIENGKCLAGEVLKCCSQGTRYDVCGKCFFLGENGCTGKNIECKTFLCTKAKEVDKRLTEAMSFIEAIAKLYELAN